MSEQVTWKRVKKWGMTQYLFTSETHTLNVFGRRGDWTVRACFHESADSQNYLIFEIFGLKTMDAAKCAAVKTLELLKPFSRTSHENL